MSQRRMWAGTVAFGILTSAVSTFFLGLYAAIANADVYGRLSETKWVGRYPSGDVPTPRPTIRLVLHRLVSEENAVEVSIVFIADGAVIADPEWRGLNLQVTVYDSSSLQPALLTQGLPVHIEPMFPGHGGYVAEGQRFLLPGVPSSRGYPFDDVGVYFTASLRGEQGFTYPYALEVTKMVPGRLLVVNDDALNARATLTRSGVEATLVVLLGVLFILLSIALAGVLAFSGETMRGWQEVLALAGYVIGAAGFRDMLGITRSSGVSMFEVFVFGVPSVVLVCSMAYVFLRDLRIVQLRPSAAVESVPPSPEGNDGQ